MNLPHFVTKIDEVNAEMPISYANAILGSKENLYYMLKSEGLYLPKIEASCIKTDYLLGVANNKYFSISINKVTFCPKQTKKVSKLDLFLDIQSKMENIIFGFDINYLPDREWLVNILFTIDPNNKVFSSGNKLDKLVMVPLRFLDRFKFINPDITNKCSNILKLRPDEKIHKEKLIMEERYNKKVRRKNYLKTYISKLEGDIVDM